MRGEEAHFFFFFFGFVLQSTSSFFVLLSTAAYIQHSIMHAAHVEDNGGNPNVTGFPGLETNVGMIFSKMHLN
jgi:hypothetical protein